MKRKENDEDFQMAPMIDMVFLLLVFFMTVSTLAQEERVPVELAESSEAEVPEDSRHRGVLTATLEEDGIVWWHGLRALERDHMGGLIEHWVKTEPELRLQLRVAEDIPFNEVRQVLQKAAEAGAVRVVYSTFQR